MSLRLTDEEFDLALKPVVRPTPQGQWRCVFAIPAAHTHLACEHPKVWRHFFADEWLWIEEAFATEGAADARGKDVLANAERHGVHGFAYRRAEYFPDYASGGA